MTATPPKPEVEAPVTGFKAFAHAIARRLIVPLLLIILGFGLYMPGLSWGLPTTVSWSQDNIAGFRALGPVADWPEDWKGRYPPLQYFVLSAAYQPVLNSWKADGDLVETPGGQLSLAPPHAPKIGLLILIARVITMAMAVLAGIALFAAGLRITGSEFAGAAAAVTLMTGAAYTYFAHLANVDIPSIFWFCVSLYLFARAVSTRHALDCALLGVAAALAVGTKDALAGVYPGMALVLWLTDAQGLANGRAWLAAAWRSLWRVRWAVGLICFALPFLFLNGIFHNPEGYLERIRYWLDFDANTLHARQQRYDGQIALLFATFSYAAGAVGWPLLVAMIGATVYCLRRHARVALIVLTPVISYYLIVIARIDFVYSRFLFAPLALLGILVGMALRDWWRQAHLPLATRCVLPMLVFLPTLGYAIAIDLEMTRDSRYAAEAWFLENAPPPADVGAFPAFEGFPFKPHYLPRLADLGYRTYPVLMSRDSFTSTQPAYLALTQYTWEDFNERQRECMNALVAGELGYEVVAQFDKQFLGTGRSWLALAGWGAPTPGKISPSLIILRRMNADPE